MEQVKPATAAQGPIERKGGALSTFLNRYASEKTRTNYMMGLKSFGRFVGFELTDEGMDAYVADTKSGIRDPLGDIEGWVASVLSMRPPKTARLFLSAVKMCLRRAGVQISEDQWKDSGKLIKGSRALTIDRTFTRGELWKITNQMFPQGRAYYLLLSSSGLRPAEALALRVEDVDFAKDPITIRVRGRTSKSGDARITFCTKQSGSALQGWLARPYKKDDGMLFDFDEKLAGKVWRRAIKALDLTQRDPDTHHFELHPYSCRKWFLSTAKLTMPVTIAEALAGHEAYLDEAYRRYSPDQMAGYYKKAETTLTAVDEDLVRLIEGDDEGDMGAGKGK